MCEIKVNWREWCGSCRRCLSPVVNIWQLTPVWFVRPLRWPYFHLLFSTLETTSADCIINGGPNCFPVRLPWLSSMSLLFPDHERYSFVVWWYFQYRTNPQGVSYLDYANDDVSTKFRWLKLCLHHLIHLIAEILWPWCYHGPQACTTTFIIWAPSYLPKSTRLPSQYLRKARLRWLGSVANELGTTYLHCSECHFLTR